VDEKLGDPSLLHVAHALRRIGLLPFTDPKSSSLVSIVAGAPVSGSWWGHPAGHEIWRVGEALESNPDVLIVRLWKGKLTLVHRRLWPPLVCVGSSGAAWQLDGLNEVSRHLLTLVDRMGILRNDQLPPNFSAGHQGFRPALCDLESRLLVLTRSVHTSSGAHALEAESWSAWRNRMQSPKYPGSATAAQKLLEDAARPLTPGVEPRRLFPWGRARIQQPSR
jgi:hypothetical protein